MSDGPWTVGRLRDFLAAMPDDALVHFFDYGVEHYVSGARFMPGDKAGELPDSVELAGVEDW